MHGMSEASVVSGPLLTGGRAAEGVGVGGNGPDSDPQVRAVLSHPLVTLLPPTPVSSTSIRLTWKVGVVEGVEVKRSLWKSGRGVCGRVVGKVGVEEWGD